MERSKIIMKIHIFLFMAAFLLGSVPGVPVLAAGKTYEGSEQGRHCALWSTDRLRWPQTSVGREKQECRRRAARPTAWGYSMSSAALLYR
jgi:hypothetical protein